MFLGNTDKKPLRSQGQDLAKEVIALAIEAGLAEPGQVHYGQSVRKTFNIGEAYIEFSVLLWPRDGKVGVKAFLRPWIGDGRYRLSGIEYLGADKFESIQDAAEKFAASPPTYDITEPLTAEGFNQINEIALADGWKAVSLPEKRHRKLILKAKPSDNLKVYPFFEPADIADIRRPLPWLRHACGDYEYRLIFVGEDSDAYAELKAGYELAVNTAYPNISECFSSGDFLRKCQLDKASDGSLCPGERLPETPSEVSGTCTIPVLNLKLTNRCGDRFSIYINAKGFWKLLDHNKSIGFGKIEFPEPLIAPGDGGMVLAPAQWKNGWELARAIVFDISKNMSEKSQ
jgi:hypothetical protein